MSDSFALSVAFAMPEIFLAAIGLLLLVYGAWQGKAAAPRVGGWTLVAFAFAALMLALGGMPSLAPSMEALTSFNGMLVHDGFGRVLKLFILAGAAAALAMSLPSLREGQLARPEFPVLLLFAALGMMLMVSAHDFLMVYMGVELQSLSLYVLASFRRHAAKSSEAGLKYFILGALSSCLLLYGLSFLYGATGGTGFEATRQALASASGTPATGVVFALVFLLAALAFKISAVPFHMWTPDVYEGAPTPVTAFFAAVPKLAGLALLARLLAEPLVGLQAQSHPILLFLAIASMLLGAFGGLVQNNIKRLMAYSSIGHIGFALVGLVVGGAAGVQALLIYLGVYVVNTLAAFGVILALRRQSVFVDSLPDLAGVAKTNPVLGFAMVVVMFSMAGVPPLAGFFSKYFILLAAVEAGMVPLAILGVLASAVSAWYYLRVVKVMYFDEPIAAPCDAAQGWSLRLVTGATVMALLLFVVAPSPLLEVADQAARDLLKGAAHAVP